MGDVTHSYWGCVPGGAVLTRCYAGRGALHAICRAVVRRGHAPAGRADVT